ncbi:hypothetical protein L1887_38454 [Cichorium endivia]|nr:hypothetical protein L1887_38454 [Cichorium endivia]
MVQFMSSENNNVWQLPEPEVKSLPVEEHSMYSTETREDVPHPKRWKSSSSSGTAIQQTRFNSNELPIPQSQYNPLNETSPLGLRLRKSPSLLELAQKRLNQGNTDKGNLAIGNLEARTKRDRTKSRASSSVDKLKASHFPALLLRIGQWEYVSKHEGDLVAKCYFSKHKIVWEVLDGGLKKKFEINWADIVGLKANCEADGLGTLTIVLGKQPLFFKEINPQPRKHTQWRATSDFTDGEASTNRQHFLQCAQGVLDKHYEKLLQCDKRLNFLSQHQGIVLDFPYFPPKPPINDQDISCNNGLNIPERDRITHTAPFKTMGSSSLGLIHQDMSKEAYSSSSGMSMDFEGPKDIEPLKETTNDMLENISQILLSDNHLTADSDEKKIISRVNSLCCLLQDCQHAQQDGNVILTPDPNLISQQNRNDSFILDTSLMPQQYRNDRSTLDPNRIPQRGPNDGSTLGYGSTFGSNLIWENRTREDGSGSSRSTKLPQDYPNVQQDGNDGSTPENGSGSNEGSGISRKDSFSDLVHQLPRIASLPRFLFDISENGEILK